MIENSAASLFHLIQLEARQIAALLLEQFGKGLDGQLHPTPVESDPGTDDVRLHAVHDAGEVRIRLSMGER